MLSEPSPGATRQRGFTLLELLVAVLLFGVSLLGLAQMQVSGVRAVKDSANRTQATQLAYQAGERLRLNWDAALDGAYALNFTDQLGAPASDCVSAACSPAEMAASDLYTWQRDLRQLLPDGQGEIAAVAAGTVAVTVRWSDSDGQSELALEVAQ